MEIKLNLLDEYDVYELYRMLGNEYSRLKQENYKHIEMIDLLRGNENNELAMRRLEHENHCMGINCDYMNIIDNIRNQLEPLVDKAINRQVMFDTEELI